ncbi:MAG TPA: RecX family transcriptional regulator [Bacteroidaceae bacterium]|nr:RecX family transcriptional regulator [Bacteroidaceae bacterium]
MEINDARVSAARLCSQQERCSSDIIEKLHQWQIPDKDIDRILAFLKKENFLDDRRYATLYVKDKFRINKWGKIKIRYMLRQKQVPEELIEEALNSLSDNDYRETCLQLLRSKIKSIKDTNPLARKAKLLRFASQRGFESEVIYKAMMRLGE